MLSSALVAFVHHFAAFTLVGALVAERVLFTGAPASRRLRVVDAVYGMSAGLLLLAGLARALWLEKGPAFYFGNPFFIAKLVLFVLVGVASIYPTLVFRSAAVSPAQASRVRRILDLELAGVAGILLCASLMAKGIGF
jgi:putative membrane protein